jgi:hypothetical protein
MHRWPWPILGILFRPFGFIAPTIKLFGFPIFWYWAYLMKVTPEKPRAHWIWYLGFYSFIFSSPGTKGHVSFCHHFASVVVVRVCNLFIFSSYSLKSLNRFEPNLAEMFIGRSSTRFVILVQIGNPTWLPGPIMCSDWLKLWKSSCQKLLSWWNCNIIEMMTGWSSTKFVIFVPIAYPRWPPWLDLV